MSWAEGDLQRCFGCGVRNPVGLHLRPKARDVDDELAMSLNMDWHYGEQPGLIHSGVIATVLGEAVQLHAERLLQVDASVAELNLTFHAPVPTDVGFEVRARGRRDGDRVRSNAEVRAADGTVLARAEAVLVARSG